jgi:hypothetical protein
MKLAASAIEATWGELEQFVLGPHDAPFPEAYTVEERSAFIRGAKAIYDRVNQATERKPHGNT